MGVALVATEQLETIHCCSCSIFYAFSQALMNRRRTDGAEFFCPNGHRQVFTDSENSRLRAKLDEQTRVATQQAERAREAEAAEQRTAAELKRVKKRVANGNCPCCKRTFVNLQRHMTSKHPEMKP